MKTSPLIIVYVCRYGPKLWEQMGKETAVKKSRYDIFMSYQIYVNCILWDRIALYLNSNIEWHVK